MKPQLPPDCPLINQLTRDDDEGLSYVWKQPVTAEEIAKAEEARISCPTETIGKDG